MSEPKSDQLTRQLRMVGSDPKEIAEKAISYLRKYEGQYSEMYQETRSSAIEFLLDDLICSEPCWCTGACNRKLQILLKEYLKHGRVPRLDRFIKESIKELDQ